MDNEAQPVENRLTELKRPWTTLLAFVWGAALVRFLA